ncbi:hypothetical protein [uncultured Alcanivorax sp.]|nr:hypothetical protein [uncultured Alcanivorax sp.]
MTLHKGRYLKHTVLTCQDFGQAGRRIPACRIHQGSHDVLPVSAQ